MMIFPLKNRKQEETIVQRIEFLNEQDGVPEQILKGDLNKFFMTVPSVDRAYLAIVSYNNRKTFDVALCLKAIVNTEKERQDLVNNIGEIFAKFFKKDTHLDTLFLKDTQENDLIKVCKPFYSKRENGPGHSKGTGQIRI